MWLSDYCRTLDNLGQLKSVLMLYMCARRVTDEDIQSCHGMLLLTGIWQQVSCASMDLDISGETATDGRNGLV